MKLTQNYTSSHSNNNNYAVDICNTKFEWFLSNKIMRFTFNPGLVILSFGISFAGSYLAISVCEQYRQSRLKNVPSKLFSPLGYLIIMSICLGGVGIWCMHFTGMYALIMYNFYGERLEVRYHIGYTVFSLLLVLLFASLGFYISSHDAIFIKSKKEILECIVEDASALTISKANKITPIQMTWIIGTHSPKYLIFGGLCTGSGIIVMHYIGMVAMQFRGNIRWNAGIIVASCIIAILAATAAFWILFRFLSVYAHYEYLRIISAFIMAIAACGMHYIGMIAGRFDWDNSVTFNYHDTMSAEEAFICVISFATIISFITGIIVLSDLRYSVHKLSYELSRADETIMILPVQTNPTSYHLIQRYLKKRKHTNIQLSIINQTRHFEDDDLSYSEILLDDPINNIGTMDILNTGNSDRGSSGRRSCSTGSVSVNSTSRMASPRSLVVSPNLYNFRKYFYYYHLHHRQQQQLHLPYEEEEEVKEEKTEEKDIEQQQKVVDENETVLLKDQNEEEVEEDKEEEEQETDHEGFLMCAVDIENPVEHSS